MNEKPLRKYPAADEPDRRWIIDCDDPPPYDGRPSRQVARLLLHDDFASSRPRSNRDERRFSEQGLRIESGAMRNARRETIPDGTKMNGAPI